MDGDIIGTGWGFPLGTTAAPQWVSGDDKIRQSIWLILSTAPGERPMLPGFGCGVHDLVFTPNNWNLRGLVAAQVREALTTWEPRVDVLDVVAERPDDAHHQLIISISCRVRANNAVFNLVYPLFLSEGTGGSGARRAA